MNEIIIIGAGGHAKVIMDIVEKQKEYKIAGLIDDALEVGTLVYGYKILGNIESLGQIARNVNLGIVAIGDNWRRSLAVNRILDVAPYFMFVSAIHPSASLARGVKVGSGSVVMAGVIINSDAKIGEHCIINTGACVDHDNVIGNFATVSPGAVTGGNVKLGDFSTIALGSLIIHGKDIGEHSIIGAGSTVLSDIPSHAVAYGTPAKVVRNRQKEERYL